MLTWTGRLEKLEKLQWKQRYFICSGQWFFSETIWSKLTTVFLSCPFRTSIPWKEDNIVTQVIQWFPGQASGQWATVRPVGQKDVERLVLALQSSVSKSSETMSIRIYNLMNHWPRTQSRRDYSTRTAFFVWCAEVVRHKWQALILHKGSSSDPHLIWICLPHTFFPYEINIDKINKIIW